MTAARVDQAEPVHWRALYEATREHAGRLRDRAATLRPVDAPEGGGGR